MLAINPGSSSGSPKPSSSGGTGPEDHPGSTGRERPEGSPEIGVDPLDGRTDDQREAGELVGDLADPRPRYLEQVEGGADRRAPAQLVSGVAIERERRTSVEQLAKQRRRRGEHRAGDNVPAAGAGFDHGDQRSSAGAVELAERGQEPPDPHGARGTVALEGRVGPPVAIDRHRQAKHPSVASGNGDRCAGLTRRLRRQQVRGGSDRDLGDRAAGEHPASAGERDRFVRHLDRLARVEPGQLAVEGGVDPLASSGGVLLAEAHPASAEAGLVAVIGPRRIEVAVKLAPPVEGVGVVIEIKGSGSTEHRELGVDQQRVGPIADLGGRRGQPGARLLDKRGARVRGNRKHPRRCGEPRRSSGGGQRSAFVAGEHAFGKAEQSQLGVDVRIEPHQSLQTGTAGLVEKPADVERSGEGVAAGRALVDRPRNAGRDRVEPELGHRLEGARPLARVEPPVVDLAGPHDPGAVTFFQVWSSRTNRLGPVASG